MQSATALVAGFFLGFICIFLQYEKPLGTERELPVKQVKASRSSAIQQRSQWLNQLQRQTTFSFPKGLLQSPEKTKPQEPIQPPPNQSIHNDKLPTKNLFKALQKVLGKKAPTIIKKWKPSPSLPLSTGSPWAIQVATRTSRKSAEKLQRKLMLKGYDARLIKGYSPHNDEVEYYVRLHGFKTQKEAEMYRKKFNKNEGNFQTFCLQQ